MNVYNHIYISRVDIFVFRPGKQASLASVESQKQIGGGEKRQNKQQTVLIQIWNKIRRGIFRVNRVMTLLVHF